MMASKARVRLGMTGLDSVGHRLQHLAAMSHPRADVWVCLEEGFSFRVDAGGALQP